MRIGAEDPWALAELAKAGGPGGAHPPQPRGGLRGTPQLGNLPLRALVCDGAITGWLGYGYLRMRDYGSSLYMPSTKLCASPNALRSTKIAYFAQRKLCASLNGNSVLLPTEIVCFAQRSWLNRNCVLRPTLFAQRKLCGFPNGNCVLRSKPFAQRK